MSVGNITKVVKKRWSPTEDELLKAAVTAMGPRKWKTISEYVGTRNHVQCRQRWEKIAPGRVKGAWSWEEDSVLVSFVKEQRANDQSCEIRWAVIAQQIAGRNAKQCKHRYSTQLDPSINKRKFSEEEKQLMLELLGTMGRNWARISERLPGRTPNMIKNYFKRVERKERNTGANKRARPTTPVVKEEQQNKKACVKVAKTCIVSVCKQLDDLLDDIEDMSAADKEDELEWLDSLGNEHEESTARDSLASIGRDSILMALDGVSA